MKATSTLLFIVIAAFCFTSCGAKKTSATFEVSTSALNVSNTSYNGGLVIMGSSDLGSFTIPIPKNYSGSGGSGDKVTLDLPRASWTFSAIGWDGNIFEGNSKCGSQTVDLNSDEQTVNLQINPAKCETQADVFGSSIYRSGDAFLNFEIITCGWLYEADGQTPVSNETGNSFCNSTSYVDGKYKNWAKSVKVEVPKSINGVNSPGIQRCLASGSDGLFTSPFKLPSKGVPFVITLYNQTGCLSEDNVISKFEFSGGFDTVNSDFDSVLNKDSYAMRLFLPSYDIRRGYSSFEKPNPILCNGSPCLSPPTVIPLGKDRFIRSGSEFVVTATPTVNQSCNKLTGVTSSVVSGNPAIQPAPTLANIRSNCEMKNGQMILRLEFTSLNGTNPQLDLTFDGGSAISLTLATNNSYDAFQLGFETIGFQVFPAPNANVRDSFRAFFDNPEESGLLTQVRELLGPEGAGGVLGPGLTCSTAQAVKFVTFQDEGVKKTYKVEISDAGETPKVSAFQADAAVPENDSFDKKISISRKIGSNNFLPEMSLHFNCYYSVGRFQSFKDKDGKIEKRLLEWNTQSPSTSRVKEIRYEEEKTNGVVDRTISNVRYVWSPNDALKVYARTYSLETERNGDKFDYHAWTSQLNVSSGSPGFRYLSGTASSTNTILDPSGETTLFTSAQSTPTNLCIPKDAFEATGTCSNLPTTFVTDPNSAPGAVPSSTVQTLFNAL